jgi:hypothetical protein
MAKCRSCAATIIWARTERGNNMPLDADPSPDGNLTFNEPGVVHVWPAGSNPPFGLSRFTSHFATCVNAKKHRAS